MASLIICLRQDFGKRKAPPYDYLDPETTLKFEAQNAEEGKKR